MAVIAKWICDRDDSMFDSKKEAEAHDKVLELAEQFTALLISKIPDVNQDKAEAFGILLANNKEIIIDACKGNAEILNTIGSIQENNVTPLMAEA
ncbi:MAG: YebG family protein [Gammaproteobacteria bacterium]|nr:YebG family protein [Gammaproteobacteria bacterium]